MESRLHQRRFGSSAGGSEFVIQKKEAAAGQPLAATDATLPQDLEKAFAKLNDLQQDYDRHARELNADRWELYATWYKWALEYLENENHDVPAQITRLLEGAKTRVQGNEQKLDGDKNVLNQQQKEIAEIVKNQFCDLEFVKSLAPAFWHANDPVVLVSAPGLSASSEHRRDRQHAEKEQVACRVSGQAITALSLNIPNNKSGIDVSADDVFQIKDAVSKDTPGLPKGIGELLREALLLDPANADAIAEQAYINAKLHIRPGKDSLIGQIKQLQRTAPSATRNVKGFFPAPFALCDWDGNPWLPLFLEWEVSWQSSYASLDKVLEHWQLTREDGEFRWGGAAPDFNGATIYEGYGIVSPNAAWNLQERLEKYNETKQNQDISQVITKLGDMNMLAQTLGGFHNALIMRDQILRPRPINPRIFASNNPEDEPKDSISDFLGGLNNLASPDPDKPFFPVRAGHLKLTRLWIVDAFGQTLEIPVTQLIRAASVKQQGNDGGNFVQLSPRFAQPLRLRFDWVAAKNPQGTYPVNSPVCGWVIPNHLDHNLLFYDASGVALGSLQKILRLTEAGGMGGVPDPNEKAFFGFQCRGRCICRRPFKIPSSNILSNFWSAWAPIPATHFGICSTMRWRKQIRVSRNMIRFSPYYSGGLWR